MRGHEQMIDVAAMQRGREIAAMWNGAVERACDNIEPLQANTPEGVLAFFSQFAVVYAVWFDVENNCPVVRVVKEPKQIEPGMLYNAIPVADAAEAEAWKARFNPAAPKRPALRLAVCNGVVLAPAAP